MRIPAFPWLQLQHLDLHVYRLKSLEDMPFGDLMPNLQTASIHAFDSPPALLVLDVSGCKNLVRLVLNGAIVCRVLKPPRCWLRLDYSAWAKTGVEAGELQPTLSVANEVSLNYKDLCAPPWGLIGKTYMPSLQVLRLLLPEARADDADLLARCVRPNLPVLKSILCGDINSPSVHVMKIHIPADFGQC